MASFPRPESSDIFNSGLFNIGGESISLEEADRRYLKLGGGFISGNLSISGALITNSLDTLSLTINGTPLDLSPISGVVNGVAQANKALIVDSSRNINNVNAFRANLIGIGDNLPTTLTRDLTILESSSEPRILMGKSETSNNAFTMAYRHNSDGSTINRFVIEPFGSSNTLSITANGRVGIGSPTPTQAFEVLGNININNGSSYMIGGTSIDTRYLRTDADSTSTVLLRLYSTAAVGGTQTILRMGHTVASGDWFWRHYRDALAENNTLELLNTNSNLIGFSFGTGNGTSNGDGCLLVMNGIQGTGSWIASNQATTNGALHLNCGIPQAVPANRRYGSSTSDPSNQTGGTVSISLYSHNDIWLRGNMYATSDRRMKTNIETWIGEEAVNLLKVKPVLYNWKSDANNEKLLGFVAQDLIKEGVHGLVQTFKNEECDVECQETGEPAGRQFVVDYSKLPIYLLELIKNLYRDIEDLKQKNTVGRVADTTDKSER